MVTLAKALRVVAVPDSVMTVSIRAGNAVVSLAQLPNGRVTPGCNDIWFDGGE